MVWSKVLHALSLWTFVLSDTQIGILHDDSLKELSSEWKATLAETFRQIEFTLPLKSGFFYFKKTVPKRSVKNCVGYLSIARCSNGRKLDTYIARSTDNLPSLRLDLEDCGYESTVPLIWAKTMPHCFQSGIHHWLSEVKIRMLDKTSHLSITHGTTRWNDKECRLGQRQLPRSTLVSAEEFSRKMIEEKLLRVVSIDFLPGMRIIRNKEGNIIRCEGATAEALSMAAEKDKFSYTCMAAPENTFGSKVNKSYYNGALGVVARKEADISIAAASYSYERYQGVDFVFPMADTWTSMLIPAPRKETQTWATFSSFESEVWIATIISMIIIGILVWLTSAIQSSQLGPAFLGDILIHLFAVFCGQGSDSRQMSQAGNSSRRLLIGSWFLTTVIIINSYSSTMVSYLSVPSYKPIVDSVEELALKNPVKLAIIRGLAQEELLKSAEAGAYKILGNRLRENPDSLVSGLPEGVNRVLAGSNVLFASDSSLAKAIKDDYDKSGTCRMSIGKERFFGLLTSFHVQKGSIYWPALSESSGFTAKFANDIKVKSPCITVQNPRTQTKMQRLSLLDLLGAFLVYFIGTIIAIFCLVSELLFAKLL